MQGKQRTLDGNLSCVVRSIIGSNHHEAPITPAPQGRRRIPFETSGLSYPALRNCWPMCSMVDNARSWTTCCSSILQQQCKRRSKLRGLTFFYRSVKYALVAGSTWSFYNLDVDLFLGTYPGFEDFSSSRLVSLAVGHYNADSATADVAIPG